EADRLASTSAEQREQTAAARADVEDTLRKADRIDPDVRPRGRGGGTGGPRGATDDGDAGPRDATDTRPGRAADESAYDADVSDRTAGDQDVSDRTVADQDVSDRTVADQDVRDRTDVGDRTAYDDQDTTTTRDDRGGPEI